MKTFLIAALLALPSLTNADTFFLKDGTRLEGSVTGTLNGTVLVQTKYGPLTIQLSDIKEQKISDPEEDAAAAAPVPSSAPTASAAAPSPAAPPQASTGAATPAGQPGNSMATAPEPGLAFVTLSPSTFTRLQVYTDDGVTIATETFDASGTLLSSVGRIGDGVYTEYYPNGATKTVKTMLNGKADGTLKAYYPSGKLQAEAGYLAGLKNGPLRYYTENGRLLMEASYKADKLDGWKTEYGPDGSAASRTYYSAGRPEAAQPQTPAARPESPAQETAVPQQPASLVTVQTRRLARGELFTFRLNDKLIGRLTLDEGFNLLRKEGKVPDGTVKAFERDGTISREFVFKDNQLVLLRVYGSGASPAQYSYSDYRAVKLK